MIRRFGLSQRVILGSLLLSLSIAAVMGLTLRRFSNLLATTAHLQVADNVLVVGSQIQEDLLDLFQTQEIFDQFLSEQTWRHYFEFSQRIETFLDRVKELRGFRKQGGEVDLLNKARSEMSDLLQNATYTINPNFPIGAVSPDMLGKIRSARSRLHQQIRAMMLQERKHRIDLESLIKEQIDSIRTMMIWVVGLVLAGGISFAIYLHRAAMAPLRSLMDVMRNTDVTTHSTDLQPSGAPEMRELIESFNHMSQELSRNQKRLSSMLSLAVTVAHEVRNPIAAIGTAIQALEAGYPAGGQDKDIFPEILKEVYRVNAIISDLLVFARPRPLSSEEMKLTDLTDELKILLKPYLDKKEITLSITIQPGAERMVADKNQLHRAFLNLLTNAVDAIDNKGEIIWTIEPAGEDRLLLSLEDSGPGIPEADRDKIFDPFFSTKVKGTGLGLSIVSDIVERHGGQIQIMNGAKLRGARFEMSLPRLVKPPLEGAAQ